MRMSFFGMEFMTGYTCFRMIATSAKVRFSVDEYFRMSEAGVFGDRRVELLEGRIFRMHAQAHPHRWAVSKTMWSLRSRFAPGRFWVVVQGTLLLGRHGAPEPDLHLFDTPEGTAEKLLPKAVLVIEISDTTYRRDTGIKLRQYAAAGIQDYWIVNIPEQRVEVYRDPENPTGKKRDWRYASRTDHKRGGKVKLLAYPKISLPVSEMLP